MIDDDDNDEMEWKRLSKMTRQADKPTDHVIGPARCRLVQI